MAQKSLEVPYPELLERHVYREWLHWASFPDLISQPGTRGSPGDLMPSAGGSSHGCSHLKSSTGILTPRARSPPSCFWNESWNRSQLLEFLELQVLCSDPELHHYGLSINTGQKTSKGNRFLTPWARFIRLCLVFKFRASVNVIILLGKLCTTFQVG